MDRPDPTDRSLQQLAREHAEDERLAQDLAQQAHTLIPQDIAVKLPPLYSQEEQGENAIAIVKFCCQRREIDPFNALKLTHL